VSASAHPGLPPGFGLVWDDSTARVDRRTVVGGDPRRILRLTPAGAAAWHELRDGRIASRAAERLARYLTDAGLAHPRPPAATPAMSASVVVPVRDRADALDRCLTGLGRNYPVVVVDDGSAAAATICEVAERHGALLVRRERSGGPAAARNSGLAAVASDIVAFVDSDCRPDASWISSLVAHFADPLVGAVAPRIVPTRRDSRVTRYAARFGALDQGGRAGPVRPGARVSYVPTAALLVRRAALASVAVDGNVFDPRLRYGEDVDLVWRLHAGGWRVRYDPCVDVAHDEPARWRTVFARRFAYGTSAGPLSRRHPGAARPLVVSPLHAAAVAALLAGCPVVAVGVGAVGAARLSASTGFPLRHTVRPTVSGIVSTWRGLGRYACQFALPLVAATAVVPGHGRRARAVAAVLLAAGGVDSLRYAPARLADHAAYGAGVWTGCVRERSLRPLLPLLQSQPAHRRRTSNGKVSDE
jgi:mycofactocin system glycosyltransferase